MIMFISGGARSGKSQFAEDRAVSLYLKEKKKNKTASLYYVATAKKTDAEMEERIRIHQTTRYEQWKTIEEPFHLLSALNKCLKGDVILIDCLTIWLSNAMFEYRKTKEEIIAIVNHWVHAIRGKKIHVIFVSNDVNEGLPSADNAVQAYMYILQQIHHQVINNAEAAIQLQAGMPTYWKGEEE